jgi:hypothetical protein
LSSCSISFSSWSWPRGCFSTNVDVRGYSDGRETKIRSSSFKLSSSHRFYCCFLICAAFGMDLLPDSVFVFKIASRFSIFGLQILVY